VSATGAGEIVPVIKGSGYGLGQRALVEEASRLDLGTIAVGTVFELGEMLDSYSGEIIVLQPFEVRDKAAADAWHFLADRGHRVIRTISSTEALLALADGPGPVRVILEGRTSMQRFGFTHDELLAALADSRVRAALVEGRILLRGLALHLPIAQPADEISPRGVESSTGRVRETLRWGGNWAAELEHIGGPEAACLWVSHLDDSELGAVVRSCSTLSVRPRIGTRLWLDRTSLKARGTVLAVHPLPNGTHVGYRQRSGPRDGTLVVVSGGTSHGIGLSAPSPASSVRQQLDGWLTRHKIQPRVVGEFDDGALMTAFGREGRGVFMSPSVLEKETVAHYGVEVIGRTDELVEEFYAVSVERRITHPCVAAITQNARGRLFNG
jgi:alanine racemase